MNLFLMGSSILVCTYSIKSPVFSELNSDTNWVPGVLVTILAYWIVLADICWV